MALLVAGAVGLLAVACSSSQSSTASSPPPKDAAKVGVPFLAHEGGATVAVTDGKVVKGMVPIDVSTHSLLLVTMTGSDGVTPIVQWLATSR
jgi:hypothetical protein